MTGPGPPFVGGTAPVAPHVVQQRLAEELDGIPFGWKPELPLAPILLRADAYAELCAVVIRIVELLHRVYLGLGDTPQRRAAALGIRLDEYVAAHPFFLSEPVECRWRASIARPDVVVTASGFRVVECNVSAAVGGMSQTDLMRRAWAALHPSWARAHAAAGAEARRGLAALTVEVADALRLPRRVAVLGVPELYRADMRRHYALEAAYLREQGLDAEAVDPYDLADRLDRHTGSPWPIALRRNGPARWAEAVAGSGPLRRLVARGCVALSPQSSYLIADKRLLAVASAGSPSLTEDDARFVRRYVPWTRRVVPGPVDYEGRRQPLGDLLIRARDRFVLKRGGGRAGDDVLVGRQLAQARWRAGVESALRGGDWVAQQFEPSVVARVPVHTAAGERSQAMVPVLSPFVFSGAVHGCMARTLAATAEEAVVCVGTGAALNVVLPDGGSG
jgi:hypothetical protein